MAVAWHAGVPRSNRSAWRVDALYKSSVLAWQRSRMTCGLMLSPAPRVPSRKRQHVAHSGDEPCDQELTAKCIHDIIKTAHQHGDDHIVVLAENAAIVEETQIQVREFEKGKAEAIILRARNDAAELARRLRVSCSRQLEIANQLTQLDDTCAEIAMERAAKAEARVEELLASRQCVCCFSAERDMLLFPCRHVATCSACYGKLKNQSCPLCKANVMFNMRVYL